MASWVGCRSSIIGLQPSSLVIVATQKAKKACPLQGVLCRSGKIHHVGVLGGWLPLLCGFREHSVLCRARAGEIELGWRDEQLLCGDADPSGLDWERQGSDGLPWTSGLFSPWQMSAGSWFTSQIHLITIIYKELLWSPGSYTSVLSCGKYSDAPVSGLAHSAQCSFLSRLSYCTWNLSGIQELCFDVSSLYLHCRMFLSRWKLWPTCAFKIHLVGHNQHFYFIFCTKK